MLKTKALSPPTSPIILLHVTIIYAVEVICVHCICMVETLEGVNYGASHLNSALCSMMAH